jgi:hypothetical protein
MPAIERIQVLDYNGLGNLFIDWATGKSKAPTDLAGFVDATVVKNKFLAALPKYYLTFQTVQTDKLSNLLIRLPPKDLVQDTLDNIGDPYSYPDVIYGPRQIPDNRIFFGARVGDYTIALCS